MAQSLFRADETGWARALTEITITAIAQEKNKCETMFGLCVGAANDRRKGRATQENWKSTKKTEKKTNKFSLNKKTGSTFSGRTVVILILNVSVLRMQSSDTNRNMNKVGVLPIWKVKSRLSSERTPIIWV